MDTSESKSEIPGKFWNVALEKDREDQLDRSCEKRGNMKQSQGESIVYTIKSRKAIWIRHVLRRNCLVKHIIKGKIEGRLEVKGRKGRRRKQLLDYINETRGYWKLQDEALDRMC